MNIVAIIVSYKNEETTCNFTDKELSKCKEITNVVIVNNAATVNSDTKIRTGIKDCEQYDGKAYSMTPVPCHLVPCHLPVTFDAIHHPGSCGQAQRTRCVWQ